MRLAVLMMALLVPATSPASTKVLLLDDIGSEQARFSWNRVYGGRVELSATVSQRACLDENCTEFYSTGALDGFKREASDVYYVGQAGEAPVLCGRTHGFFDAPRFYDACRISVEPEQECQDWYAAGDCVRAVTRYRVYLTIDD